MPNKHIRFWHELKRRRVVHVLVVYATAAFVILEAVDIIFPRLNFPDWTVTFVMILLAVGFPLALIFSWIFDITPEGIEKTKPESGETKNTTPRSSNSWRIATYVSLVVILGLVAYNILGSKKRTPIDESLSKSIAVLPFHNYSGDPGQDYICEGLTDEIISHLFKVRSFDEVRSLTSVRPFRDSEKSTTEIAQALQVNYILEGTYKKMGEELKITAQLIEANSDKHIWLQDYELPYREVIGIPGEIALQIAGHLKAFITGEEQQEIDKMPTSNLEAYDYYLLGKQRLKVLKDEDLWKAIEYLQRAVELDSSFALAYSGLAHAFYLLANYAIASPAMAYPAAKSNAMKALELDDNLAYAHCLTGVVSLFFEYDFPGAEKAFLKALEIDPRSLETLNYYSALLSLSARYEEAFSTINTAIEIDPFSYGSKSMHATILYAMGRRDEAFRYMEELRKSYPEYPNSYWWLANRYCRIGEYDRALSMLEKQYAVTQENDNPSDEIALEGAIYARLGRIAEAEKQLNKLDELALQGFYVWPRTRATILLGLGRLDEAFDLIEEAIADHTIAPTFLVHFINESFASHPRYIELMKKMGLDPQRFNIGT